MITHDPEDLKPRDALAGLAMFKMFDRPDSVAPENFDAALSLARKAYAVADAMIAESMRGLPPSPRVTCGQCGVSMPGTRTDSLGSHQHAIGCPDYRQGPPLAPPAAVRR